MANVEFGDLFQPIENPCTRYIGRKCRPIERGLLYFAMNQGYIQLDARQKWNMEYVPEKDTCFMAYKQLHVKISTATFKQMFTLTEDAAGAVERAMKRIWKND